MLASPPAPVVETAENTTSCEVPVAVNVCDTGTHVTTSSTTGSTVTGAEASTPVYRIWRTWLFVVAGAANGLIWGVSYGIALTAENWALG